MQSELLFDIERRTDYTFKYNARLGRHGWLRLTPAYSVKLVKDILKQHSRESLKILDPFAGTATTGLVAAELNCDAILFDINPFLIWLGNLKCTSFASSDLVKFESNLLKWVETIKVSDGHWVPPIYNIERWWHPETLKVLASIRNSILMNFGLPYGTEMYNLLWVAFSRLIIETSTAAFNHVSMSFKNQSVYYEFTYIKVLFREIIRHILYSADTQVLGNASVVKCDARTPHLSGQNGFKMVITSPPYPNRISYIRELRPYMYWINFLGSASDAGLLDWEAIGGTWGVATSKLNEWECQNSGLPNELHETCQKINDSGDKNSKLMSKYVNKYFDDMYSHIINLRHILASDCKLNYIVGNSSFYGIFVNTESIISSMFESAGYSNVEVDTIRKRNSKKGLLEFNVKACWTD